MKGPGREAGALQVVVVVDFELFPWPVASRRRVRALPDHVRHQLAVAIYVDGTLAMVVSDDAPGLHREHLAAAPAPHSRRRSAYRPFP